jgi:F-box interacting protein
MMPVESIVAATELDDLPEEIVVDKILVLLPAKDVGRCRAVRTSWRSATSTPEFMLAHHRCQPSFPIVEREDRVGVFRASAGGRACYQQLWPTLPSGHYVGLHAASDGFVVVSVLSRFYICNPAIHQLAPLKQPEFELTNTILGLYRHAATGEYRVLWSSAVDGERNERILHVITIGHNQSRNIGVKLSTVSSSPSQEQALLEALPRDRYSAYKPPVHHRGNLHWLSKRQIIAFDTATELFRYMRGATDSDSLKRLIDVQGKLGFCSPDCQFTYMDVWVMEDYEAEIWEVKYRIDMSSIEVSRSLHLTSPKKEKRKRTVNRMNPMVRILSAITTLNEHELLLGYNDKQVLRCNIDGKFLGMANIGKSKYNMELTQHRLKESIAPIPPREMQEER